jgi:hypothetical protein
MSHKPSDPALPLDLNAARDFLAALDPTADAKFAFRGIRDRGDGAAVKAYGTLDRGVRQSSNSQKNGKFCRPGELLTYLQGLGFGAFVGVSRFDGQGQSDKNVVGCRVAIADADTALQVEQAERFIEKSGLRVTVRTASGGLDHGVEKRQYFWRIRGLPVDKFTAVHRALITRTGTDPSITNCSRVMRLVGYDHLKSEPRQTRIISIDSTVEYDVREFLARVLAQPQICDPWAGGKGQGRIAPRGRLPGQAGQVPTAGPKARLGALLDRYGDLITPAVRALLREATAPAEGQPGNRHATLITVVGRCIQAGWPDADIRGLVLPTVNTEWGDGDWSAHLDQILTWTREQHDAAIAAMPAAPSSIAAAFGAGGVL